MKIARVYHDAVSHTGHIMKLASAKAGNTFCITNIQTQEQSKVRLDCLGLIEGSELFVIQSSYAGVIAKVKGTRVALCKSLAKEIEVEELSQHDQAVGV